MRISHTNQSLALGERVHHRSVVRFTRSGVLDFLAFLIPALRFIDIEMVGRLFLSEIVIISIFPVLFIKHGRKLGKQLPRVFILLALLWLFGQIFTDIVVDAAFNDYIRGWMKIALTIISFSCLFILLYGNERRIILFSAGLIVGGLLSFYMGQDSLIQVEPWKFGLAQPVTLLFVLVAARFNNGSQRNRLIVVTVMMFITVLNFYFGSRGLGGISFLTGMFVFFQPTLASLRNRKKPNKSSTFLVAVIAILASWAVLSGYEYAVSEGLLGEKAKRKYEMQAGGDFGLLLGGRSEIFVSLQAIYDSPIIGHGSWAKDNKYAEQLQYLKRQLGYVVNGEVESEKIPSHSHIFGAWVEAGVVGAIFWLWILALAVRVLRMLYVNYERLSPLYVYFSIIIIWDVFFSPYGFSRRFITPYYIIVLMHALMHVDVIKQAHRSVLSHWRSVRI